MEEKLREILFLPSLLLYLTKIILKIGIKLCTCLYMWYYLSIVKTNVSIKKIRANATKTHNFLINYFYLGKKTILSLIVGIIFLNLIVIGYQFQTSIKNQKPINIDSPELKMNDLNLLLNPFSKITSPSQFGNSSSGEYDDIINSVLFHPCDRLM